MERSDHCPLCQELELEGGLMTPLDVALLGDNGKACFLGGTRS